MRQQYCSLLLTSILSMLNENGPTAFFDQNGNDSVSLITLLEATSMYLCGYTFKLKTLSFMFCRFGINLSCYASCHNLNRKTLRTCLVMFLVFLTYIVYFIQKHIKAKKKHVRETLSFFFLRVRETLFYFMNLVDNMTNDVSTLTEVRYYVLIN